MSVCLSVCLSGWMDGWMECNKFTVQNSVLLIELVLSGPLDNAFTFFVYENGLIMSGLQAACG